MKMKIISPKISLNFPFSIDVSKFRIFNTFIKKTEKMNPLNVYKKYSDTNYEYIQRVELFENEIDNLIYIVEEDYSSVIYILISLYYIKILVN